MGKGLCDKDKNWLTQITDIGKKLTNILQKAKNSINEMFSDKTIAAEITSVHKSVKISFGNASDGCLSA